MKTLLILGSKPNPSLPPASHYQALACANASGFSARQLGLPSPTYTVMSAILTAGDSTTHHNLQALRGLSTETLYFFPRQPVQTAYPLKRILIYLRHWQMQPWYFRLTLYRVDYRYQRFVNLPWLYYHDLLKKLCHQDTDIMAQIERKQPSTGIMALVIGMTIVHPPYDRFILSGFSFELTHAYGENPEITRRGTVISKHAQTDIAILSYLANHYPTLFTTEPVVNERTGIPLLTYSHIPDTV